MRHFSIFLFAANLLATLVVPATATPLAPSGLTAVASSSTRVAISWIDNSNNEVSFVVSRRIPPATSFSVLGSVGANSTGATISGLIPNTTYEYVVVAVDSGNVQSAASNVATVTTTVVTSANLRGAYLQEPFSFNITSSNPSIVSNYAITALPAGLTINPTSGLISGIPNGQTGSTTGQIMITHTSGLIINSSFTLRVFSRPPSLAAPISGPALADRIFSIDATVPDISVLSQFTDPDVSSAARLTTLVGDIDFVFYENAAATHVANFLGYLNRGDFINTIFHRSVPGFIIQGGAFRADATASAVPTQPPILNSPSISNLRGTVSMARSTLNSATNQFFINLADNGVNNLNNLDSGSSSNGGFTIFARVPETSMVVADSIADLAIKNYVAINGALGSTPVLGNPAVYDPAALVKIIATTNISPLSLSASSTPAGIVNPTIIGTNLSLTPLLPGTTTVTLIATDLDGQSITSSFKVTLTDTYQNWASRQVFLLPTDALSTADPDQDGKPNLIEYALGTSPNATDPEPIEVKFTEPTQRLRLTVKPSSSPRGNVIWKAQFSSTLDFSHSFDVDPVSVPLDPPENGVTLLEFTDLGTIPKAMRFGRLKISLP